ncbi:hypothetical protein EBZ70_10015 [bacterium]|nr:hypothetical protein [bacterium]
MNRHPLRLLSSTLLLAAIFHAPPLRAQAAADLNEGLRLTANTATPGTYEVSWWGRAGHTYFLQRSEDLIAPWGYFPLIETGRDAAVRYGFSTPNDRIFVRLRLQESTLADPYGADSDGDGIPDGWELEHGLNPFDASDATVVVANLSNLALYQNSVGPGADPTTTTPTGLVVYSP